jgi:hypothetical protein
VHPSTEIDWCDQAARAGHVEVLQWLCTEGQCRLWGSVSQIAAALGHLHVFEWVVDNTVDRPDVPLRARANSGMSVCFQAVIGGQVHVLKWAFAKGWICRDRRGATDLFEAAVRAGQVNALDWI